MWSLSTYSSDILYDRAYIKHLAKITVEQIIPVPANGKTIVSPSNIDPRINIKPCSESLQANIPENYSSRNVNVKIFCSGSIPWQIYLPVKVSIQIPVVVATRKINKGMLLSADNIGIEWRDLYKTRGQTLDDPTKLYGARSFRNVNHGKLLSEQMICVVCKGENVTIIAQSNDLMIKTEGIALKNAMFGQQVPVKNTHSGKTITAQVKTMNQVVIHL